MLPIVRALSFIPILLVAKLRREERRLVEWFRARGALDAERAVTVAEGGAIAEFVRRRLRRAGAVRTAGTRYYFDETSYNRYRDRRRRRAFVVLTLLVIAIGIGFLTGVLTP